MAGLNWQRASSEDADETQAALPLGDAEWLAEAQEEPERPRRWTEIALVSAMLLLAIVWVAILGMLVAATAPASGIGMSRAAAWIGVGSGPLTLLALLALVMLRTGRVEASRYARAARDLRMESLRLAELLTLVDRRITVARQGLAKHGAELMQMGEEASERLGRAGETLRADMGLVSDVAAKLDDATATARTDLGVLMADLPTLESRAGALGERLRFIGQDVEEKSAVLNGALAGIETQARAADQSSVAAARRLAIELERIEGSAAAADRRIAEVTGKVGEAADGALINVATALDQVRRGVAEQGTALSAIVAQARDVLGRSGEEASRALSLRLDQLSARIEETSLRIAQHEAAARGLLGQLEQALGGVEGRFEQLGDNGAEHVATLAETLATLAEHGEQIGALLGRSGETAETTLGRVAALRDQASRANDVLGGELPETLQQLRAQADEALALLGAARPQADELVRTAGDLQGRLAESGALIEIGSERIMRLAAQTGEQVAAARRQMTALGETGDEQMARFATQAGETLAAVHGQMAGLGPTSDVHLASLAARTGETLAAVREQMADLGPAGDAHLASLAARTAETLARVREQMAGLEQAGGAHLASLATRSGETLATISEQMAALGAAGDEHLASLVGRADEKLATVRERLVAFETLVAQTDQDIATLADGASVRLVDALLRVRETAAQAAAHARETLAATVPEAASSLANASAEAMATALAGVSQAEIGKVEEAASQAADAASAASERLTRQLVSLTEMTRSVEARIAEHEAAASATDEQGFARAVGLLIEALNSTAIDVAKIFSNEPTDSEWAAYLKGDRGVFTRRAVRLIEAGDAKAICQRYNDDAEFRTQVNRYVHDFEAMLRRVLAVREGAAMGVTLLSSDMGKLYVALAQAIERLRR